MTPEKLLKPRKKLIYTWPGCIYREGEIFQLRGGWWFPVKGVDQGIDNREVEKHPKVFKEIFWWEDRKESDMPEYVKLVIDGKIQYVHKVELYNGENCNGIPLYEYKNRSDFQTIGSLDYTLPATKEDYLEYETQKL